MGTLYYLLKDEPREAFALNKVYEAYAVWERAKGVTAAEAFGSPVALAEELKALRNATFPGHAGDDLSYLDRAAARVFAWAKEDGIEFQSEHGIDLARDEGAAPWPITGSYYDSDYEADGTTYKPGSAW